MRCCVRRQGSAQALFIFPGGDALAFFKHTAEIVDGLKSGLFRDGGDGFLGKTQKFSGFCQTAAADVLHSALVEGFSEQSVQLAGIHAGDPAQNINGQFFPQMGMNVGAYLGQRAVIQVGEAGSGGGKSRVCLASRTAAGIRSRSR